jgi:2-(1,2-epoxy-1,2-dihydrophenyl)acetyl-CoA isomerase
MNDAPAIASPEALAAVRHFYDCLADSENISALREALTQDFVLTLSPGLPLPVDRVFRSRDDAVANAWAQIPPGVSLRCEPDRTLAVAGDEFIVLGHYRGDGWEAPFAHVLTTAGGKLSSLRQITDTRSWPDLTATPSGH